MQTIETKWKENLNFASLLYTPSVCSGGTRGRGSGKAGARAESLDRRSQAPTTKLSGGVPAGGGSGAAHGPKEKVGRLPGTKILKGATKTQQRASLTSWLSRPSLPQGGPKCTVEVSCEPEVCQKKATKEVACNPTTGPGGPDIGRHPLEKKGKEGAEKGKEQRRSARESLKRDTGPDEREGCQDPS